ncbi:MAG: type I restriction enzyme HsdR N-terminal domain-containing protein [Paludibacter sp.]|jgi:type I site-specific restriction-modification system R (restriction) subunit|nr:type I restriction enzyme HsdR N-terminal domain-containing protein [Paludibacter sp.]
MFKLNLPTYNFRIKKAAEKFFIFDSLRKKFVSLTPEEWVRQNFLRFLVEEKQYPAALIAVEKQLNVNGLRKRFDALIYGNNAEPLVIVEFKAPNVEITQSVFDQAATYNLSLNVGYFIISNGISHHFCKLDKENLKYIFYNDIPNYSAVL